MILVEVDTFYADLGRRLRFHRERRHMTQEQLGASLDPATTRASIANVEAGKQRVLAHTLVQLAETLSVSVGELLPAPQKPLDDAIKVELRHKLDELPSGHLRRVVESLTSKKSRRVK